MRRATYQQAAMSRTLYGVASPASVGVAFTATVPETPRPGLVWVIRHAVVEIPAYVSGAVSAVLYIGAPGALQRVAGTNQGQFDALDNVARRVHAGEQVAVTWNPTRVVGIVQGKVTLQVVQGAPELVGG